MKLSYKDFNTKTFKEIQAIPGIGRKTASAIVSMRPFKTDNDLFCDACIKCLEIVETRTSTLKKL